LLSGLSPEVRAHDKLTIHLDPITRARTRAEHIVVSCHIAGLNYTSTVPVVGARMALRLRDVRRDTIANRALNQLMDDYTVAEEKSRLVLTKKSGDIKLFLYELDDLHQLDFIYNQQMVREIEQLRVLSTTVDQQRETWKVRALMAEAQLLEAIAKISNNGGSQKVTDLRYASLKRYLAKRFHPDYAPGDGIEKIVRNEIFKEIWNEVDRLDEGVAATRFGIERSSSAA
jgi:hypothetical protein